MVCNHDLWETDCESFVSILVKKGICLREVSRRWR